MEWEGQESENKSFQFYYDWFIVWCFEDLSLARDDALLLEVFKLKAYVFVKMRHGFKEKVTLMWNFLDSAKKEKCTALRPGHVNKKTNNYVFCTVQQPTMPLDNHIYNNNMLLTCPKKNKVWEILLFT